MKCQVFVAMFVCCLVAVGCESEVAKTADQTPPSVVDNAVPVSPTRFVNQIVEASCGQCQFDMKDKRGCDLAVRIDGQSYFVDGSLLDGHGDAHGDDGLCNCIRQARVTGEIKDGRFVSTAFELLPVAKDENK